MARLSAKDVSAVKALWSILEHTINPNTCILVNENGNLVEGMEFVGVFFRLMGASEDVHRNKLIAKTLLL
jgi:hypothetical protein